MLLNTMTRGAGQLTQLVFGCHGNSFFPLVTYVIDLHIDYVDYDGSCHIVYGLHN